MAERKTLGRGLGRGLSALLGEDDQDMARLDRGRTSKAVAIELLSPGRFQPRRRMDDAAIETLAESIRDKGVLQPLLVRRHPDDPKGYEIVAGERRWRAAQMAGLHEVPVVIKALDDRETLEIALIENLQREDLTPVDEAVAFRRLMDEFGHTQDALAQAMGRSRSHIANTLRLLGLPDEIKSMLADRQLSAGHARALIGAADAVALARRAVKDGLSVRDVERLSRAPGHSSAANDSRAGKASGATVKDADTRALEADLSETLGLRVEIAHQAPGGRLVMHYRSLDQLDGIIKRIGSGTGSAPSGGAARQRPTVSTGTKKPSIDQPKLSVTLKPKGKTIRPAAPPRRG